FCLIRRKALPMLNPNVFCAKAYIAYSSGY
ncbi:MAG: hypothetical protein ACI95X_002573, partial [Paraglaciecola sp.]